MASRWQTYPLIFSGGLVTNKPLLQQGLELPGSAVELTNVEPAIEGGYQKIKGFQKYTDDPIPPYGINNNIGKVVSSTKIWLHNISDSPKIGDTFTIDGLSTSNLQVKEVSYYSSGNRAVVTLESYTGDAITSAVEGNNISWISVESPPDGIYMMNTGKAIVKRGGFLWVAEENDFWEPVRLENYALDVLRLPRTLGNYNVGDSTLSLQNLKTRPRIRDQFSISGDPTVYTVAEYVGDSQLDGENITVKIYPRLKTAVSGNTKVNFLYAGITPGGNLKGSNFQFGLSTEFVFADGRAEPWKLNTSGKLEWLSEETLGSGTANDIAVFKSTVFLADHNLLIFSAPSNDQDYSPAGGAGVINIGDEITRLWPFKTSLIVFCRYRIMILSGNSAADLVLTTITDEIGCEASDSVQDVGGDIVFLAPDGVRYLSDTDRSGSFGVSPASESIRRNMAQFQSQFRSNVCSVVLREKNQYRIFGYARGEDSQKLGFGATRYPEQGLQWFYLNGLNVQRAHSFFTAQEEIVLFTNHTEYVYRMDKSNGFDGENINWAVTTPPLSFTDPIKRKSMYKVTGFLRHNSDFAGSLDVVLDFLRQNEIQPSTLTYDISAGDVYGSSFSYGNSLWGGSTGGNFFGINTPCSGFTFTLRIYGSDRRQPFVLDNLLLEFSEQGRQ